MALFCVEAMRLFTMTGVDTASSQIINNHSNQIMFRDLFNFATSLGDDFFERDISVMYILCSIPLSELFTLFQSFDVTKKIQELILHLFIQKGGMVCPLLKSLYAELLNKLDGEQILILANQLSRVALNVDTNTYYQTAASIYCFKVMVDVVKGQVQRQSLRKIVKLFVCLAMKLHFSPSIAPGSVSGWESCIYISQSFISTVMAKKDILNFNGLEISNIVSKVNIIFDDEQKFSSSSIPFITSKIFASSCELLNSILKHYPKQLYGCLPSYVGVIRSHFKHILQSEGRQSIQINEKTKQIVKLC